MLKNFQKLLIVLMLIAVSLGLGLPQSATYAQDELTVTITSTETDPTNASPFEVTVTFSADVTGFEADDVEVTNGAVTSFDGEDDVYTLEITPEEDGLVSVDIPAGVAEDDDENENLAAETFSITYDGTAPTVEITSTSPDPTGDPLIPVTITFSEPVTGLEVTEVAAGLTNATIEVYVSGSTVVDMVIKAIDYGTVSVDLPAGVAFDLAGNPNEAAETFTIEYVENPLVTVNQAEGQEDPTYRSPILFNIVFNKNVIGFEAEHVDITGTAPGDLAVTLSGSGAQYIAAVSGMTGPGTVIASVPADVVEDAEGNLNLASTSTDNTVTYLGPPPEVLSIERLSPNPSQAPMVNYFLTFSEPVFEVGVDDFTLTTTGTLTGAAIMNVAGTGDQRFVTVETGIGAGTLRLDIAEDAAIFNADDIPLIDLPYTDGEVYSIRIQTFTDVNLGYWAWAAIEQLFMAGVTDGCVPTPPRQYCPDDDVTRAEMAKFLLTAINGADFEPEVDISEGTSFEDVAGGFWAAAWIEQLYQDGLTDGCSSDPLLFCPNDKVTRAEMAKFLMAAINVEDPTYEPPEVEESSFSDIPDDYWAIDWIEALYDEGVTTGCSSDPLRYCPQLNVTRAEMALFLVRAFDLD